MARVKCKVNLCRGDSEEPFGGKEQQRVKEQWTVLWTLETGELGLGLMQVGGDRMWLRLFQSQTVESEA